MKNIYKLFLVSLLSGGLFFSCETTELDLANSPNALTEDQASIDLFINSIQLSFVGGIEGINGLGAQLTRIEQFAGRNYLNALQPGTLNGFWASAYPGMFEDIATMIPLAQQQGFTNHIGVAQALQAYYLVSLVDMIGDVPFSEANNALEFPLPGVDSGEAVYAAALDLLDQADANFTPNSPPLEIDFFYEEEEDLDGDGALDFNIPAWNRLTNTMRMRIYLQTRLVDPNALTNFNAIANSGNFIQDSSQDFQFTWGSNFQQPGTRHPEYGANYTPSGANIYRSNWLMNLMATTNDPRIRYYFLRQSDCTPGASCMPEGDEQNLQCSLQTPPQHYIDQGFGDLFCFLEDGFWGRDHGNAEGIPPDGPIRTSSGVYPSAGVFDDDTFAFESDLDNGGQGAGISPFILASFVDFWRAEVALLNGNPPMAGTFIEDGINKSIIKVQGFSNLDPGANSAFFPTMADNADFVTMIGTSFDTGSIEDQWNILAEQYWVTLYGAGIDAYNFYRRTGFPTTLQPNLEPDPGSFPRSLFYPLSEAASNSNITQKPDLNQQVFWDNNPPSAAVGGFPVSN